MLHDAEAVDDTDKPSCSIHTNAGCVDHSANYQLHWVIVGEKSSPEAKYIALSAGLIREGPKSPLL